MNVAFMDNSLTETGFTLQRALDSNFTQSMVPIPLPANPGSGPVSYSDTGVVGGTVYYYRVLAFNANGNSAWSNTAQSQCRHRPSPSRPLAIRPDGVAADHAGRHRHLRLAG